MISGATDISGLDWTDRKSGGPLGNGFADGGKKMPATDYAVPGRAGSRIFNQQAPAQVYENVDGLERT